MGVNIDRVVPFWELVYCFFLGFYVLLHSTTIEIKMHMSYSQKLLLIVVLSLCWGVVMGQNRFAVSGTIKDASNGEDLPGATVRVKELSGVGGAANIYGFYSLSLPQGSYTLIYQYIGYGQLEKEIELSDNLVVEVELEPNAKALTTVVIAAEKEDQNVSDNQMSTVSITPEDVKSIPVLLGERDVVKILQLSPGVKSAGEGNSGFFVRGGAADQNLILLDEAPVYNPAHLLGFFSVFNSEAIKNVTLYKGGMPPQYGGRASSVMDITMRDGNSKEFSGAGSVGLISSKLILEGPIVKNKGSFIVTGRRTYADLFLNFSSDTSLRQSKLYFYDLTAKANYKLGSKDRIYLSGYFGRDVLGFSNQFNMDWGNSTATMRWNHLFSSRLFSNTTVIYSDYNYKIGVGTGVNSLYISSRIQDWNLKQDFTYFLNSNNTIRLGANAIHHHFIPGELDAGNEANSVKLNDRYAMEGGAYLQNQQKLGARLSLLYGMRYSMFSLMGKGNAYTFNDAGTILTTQTYSQWQAIQYYSGLEPRISARYLVGRSSSLKASIDRNYRYLHQLSNSTSAQPTDIWVPSSNNIKPQIASQAALGYFQNFDENTYELSVEAYYKDLQNQIDYKDGAQLLLNETVESELVYGSGVAYGAEFQFKKTKGKLTGWISYTLSRSLRRFDAINNGDFYPAKQDRIHDISVVGMYSLSDRLVLSANWVYYTGNAVTFPSGRYVVDGQVVPLYTERNGYRMPNYHRLDVGLTLEGKEREHYHSSWNFSVYNAYANQNAYSITFRPNQADLTQTEAVRTALFVAIPSITYNFKF